MQDMKTQLEKLRTAAADCALIRDLATDPKKRELFTRLAEHLSVLAAEVEAAIAGQLAGRAVDSRPKRATAGFVPRLFTRFVIGRTADVNPLGP